jgi:hypothetical protein
MGINLTPFEIVLLFVFSKVSSHSCSKNYKVSFIFENMFKNLIQPTIGTNWGALGNLNTLGTPLETLCEQNGNMVKTLKLKKSNHPPPPLKKQNLGRSLQFYSK